MTFSQGSSLGFSQAPQGQYLQAAISVILRNPLVGTPIYHYQAQHADSDQFNEIGQPDYLASDPGVFESGIQYVANPDNPIRGIFCARKLNPYQDKGGIYYQGEFEVYLPSDPGEVFILDDKYPKRQDKFVINGGNYYATAPVFPCLMGETVAAWQVFLSRERYPVSNNNGL